MTMEKARARLVAKPWGRRDLAPWSALDTHGEAIGELWFERTDPSAPATSLLLKLLFTSRPLSIQVHPDDEHAHALGLAGGKTEAWYVLAADPGADVALGPRRTITAEALGAAIEDGSIVDLVARRPVAPNDVVFVPAGTIHAVGGGLVIAEIQQRSDVTWRLYDYGSDRELHVEKAMAVAILDPAIRSAPPRAAVDGRSRLVGCPQFLLERLDLPAVARRAVSVTRETWLLVVRGDVRIGSLAATLGEAVYLDRTTTTLTAGPAGAEILLAHAGRRPHPRPTHHRARHSAGSPAPVLEVLT